MYKPYTGLYEDNDVIVVRDESGNIVNERASNADSPNARHDESTLDIMGVDFSDDTTWENWTYEEYIGVDVVTGRVKFPPGYDANLYWIEFNFKELTTTLDAKSILRHGEAISVEDSLRFKETEAILYTMHSDGTVTAGDLAYVTTSTGEYVLTKFESTDTAYFDAVVGICYNVPSVNKLGAPNPVNICLNGTVRLTMASTAGWSIGDSAFLLSTTGLVEKDATGVSWFQAKKLGVVLDIETDTYLELFIDAS
jgi:hypothetical protein